MAEIPEVVTLTTISKDWGNLVASRTVQRYSSVANRTTEHSSPVEGDLSYLEDSNTVWVYDGAAWVNIAAPVQTVDLADGAVTAVKLGGAIASTFEVDGSVEVASFLTSGTMATAATVNLTIPATWASWKCSVSASWAAFHSTAGVTHEARIVIDGTAQQTLAGLPPYVQSATAAENVPCSLVARRSGMTTTGSRAITLQGRHVSAIGSMNDIAVYARAVRLT